MSLFGEMMSEADAKDARIEHLEAALSDAITHINPAYDDPDQRAIASAAQVQAQDALDQTEKTE